MGRRPPLASNSRTHTHTHKNPKIGRGRGRESVGRCSARELGIFQSFDPKDARRQYTPRATDGRVAALFPPLSFFRRSLVASRLYAAPAARTVLFAALYVLFFILDSASRRTACDTLGLTSDSSTNSLDPRPRAHLNEISGLVSLQNASHAEHVTSSPPPASREPRVGICHV